MSTDSPTGRVLAGLDTIRAWQENVYLYLHQHPELSHQERRTGELVATHLRESGYDVHEGVGGTGVIGVLRNGEGATVLLRADMDALPVREQTGLPYASTATATDQDGNQVPVMHACGHDVHVTCLLGAATLLSRDPSSWSGTVVALFQPAEEAGDGAAGMVRDGLKGLVGDVDVALAQHVLPWPAGLVATRSGPVLSAADSMRITVYGRGPTGRCPRRPWTPSSLPR
jgi:amidohydrolase